MTEESSRYTSQAEAPPPDVTEPDFDDELSTRLWEQYVERIEAKLEPLRPAVRREIVQELKIHLHDSIRHDDAEEESVRVLNATEKLGRPEEYLEPIVTDRMIEEGSNTYNPRWIVKGLGRTLTRGVKKTVLGLLFGVGYLLAVVVFGLGLLKPFFPGHVGLFYDPGDETQRIVLGFLEQTAGMTEVLGYWVIPLSLATGGLMYVGLTKMLVLLRQSE
jgi:hypothetical protein